MASKAYRIPLTDAQKEDLAKMLGQVPSHQVVHYDWTSEAGRAFIKTVRDVQLSGVPLPWIGEALDISRGALNGAVDYWARASTSSRRVHKKPEKRVPLRKKPKEAP